MTTINSTLDCSINWDNPNMSQQYNGNNMSFNLSHGQGDTSYAVAGTSHGRVDNFKIPEIPKVSHNKTSKDSYSRNVIDAEKQNIIIEKVYVRDMATQCQNDASTQTDYTLAFTENDLKNLLRVVSSATKVTDGKPVFHCKTIAAGISSIVGISITPEWIYSAYV